MRVLSFNGATAEGVSTLSAILAGGGAAREALLLVILTPVDRLVQAHPLSMFLLYIDDLGVHSRGKDEETVAKCTVEMSEHVIEILEREVGPDDLPRATRVCWRWRQDGVFGVKREIESGFEVKALEEGFSRAREGQAVGRGLRAKLCQKSEASTEETI